MRFILFVAAALSLSAADLRIGIVGTDTSHAPAFTAMMNDPAHKDHIAGVRVVAAFKGGSPDLKNSADRVNQYATELHDKYGVEIVPDIATLLTKVDAVLLESVDGRPHLAQFKEIAKGGKPVFIDKPLASTLADAREIARIAKENKVAWFTASSLRYGDAVPALRLPNLTGAFVWGPGPLEDHHQLDLSWYGIHAVEILYALMGTGCQEVTRTFADGADVTTGRWADGRLGTVRTIRPYSEFGAVVFTPKEIKPIGKEIGSGYGNLVREIVKFFQTGKPPLEEREMLEVFEFMDAAQRSRAQGGAPAKLVR
jgi:hypothetical protein